MANNQQNALSGCGCLILVIVSVSWGVSSCANNNSPSEISTTNSSQVNPRSDSTENAAPIAPEGKQEKDKQEREAKWEAEYNKTHYTNDGLSLDLNSIHSVSEDDGAGWNVVGKVTNTSSEDKDYVEITFKELDDDGNQVGTAMTNIQNLDKGQTWRFQAIVDDTRATRWQFDELKDTPLSETN